ncbi:MAG: methyltransferase domain-containing protein [Candidatus Thorarchaeota archaeon]
MALNNDSNILEEWGIPERPSARQLEDWAYMTKVWNALAGVIPDPSLDIGAGKSTGRTVSIDPFPRGPIDIRATGEELPISDGYFESVVLQSVLKHVISPADVLLESKRVSKPKSLLFVTSPVNYVDHHRHSFTTGELISLIQGAGYRILRTRGIGLMWKWPDRILHSLGARLYAYTRIPVRICRVLLIVAESVQI